MGHERTTSSRDGMKQLDFGSERLPTGGTQNPWDTPAASDKVIAPATQVAGDDDGHALPAKPSPPSE